MKKTINLIPLLSSEVIAHFDLSVKKKIITIPLYNPQAREIGRIRARCRNNSKLLTGEQILHKPSRILYNFNGLSRGRDHLIVTFGVLPVWHLWKSGFSDVIGLFGERLDPSLIDSIDSLLSPQCRLWVITAASELALTSGLIIAGQLLRLRPTRHICVPTAAKTLMECSCADIQRLFLPL